MVDAGLFLGKEGADYPNMKRALVIHSSNELYGSDRMLLEVLEVLRNRANVTVCLPSDSASLDSGLGTLLQNLDVRVTSVDLPILRRAILNFRGFSNLLKTMAALLQTIRRSKLDMVWCATSAALPAALVAKLAGVPLVYLHQQEVWGRREGYVLGALARFCGVIVTISQATLLSLPKALRERAVLISNTTPAPTTISKVPASGAVKFLIASRWTEGKGYATLLAAWQAAGEPGHLVIAGGPPPLGKGFDVAQAVVDKNLSESVTIVGEVEDLSRYIRESHYVLLPSDYPEGFGLVAIEAFANARAVIVSDAGGLSELVAPGVNGFIFERGNAEQLAHILARVDIETAARMSEAAYSAFESNYSVQQFRARLSSVFDSHGVVAV